MWLDKTLAKLFGSPKKPLLASTDSLSARERCEVALRSLDLPNTIEISAIKAQCVRINPCYASIETYIERLNMFNKMVLRKHPITALLFNGRPSGVDLDLFFVSEDNHYLDKFDAIVKFHNAAQELCENLAKSDGVQFGVQEHNARVLMSLLQNVSHICEEINQARTIN